MPFAKEFRRSTIPLRFSSVQCNYPPRRIARLHWENPNVHPILSVQWLSTSKEGVFFTYGAAPIRAAVTTVTSLWVASLRSLSGLFKSSGRGNYQDGEDRGEEDRETHSWGRHCLSVSCVLEFFERMIILVWCYRGGGGALIREMECFKEELVG